MIKSFIYYNLTYLKMEVINMNKNIIIAILIVIIIAVVAFVALSPQNTTTDDGKINTQISFLSKDTLKNGEKVEFELKDAKGNLLKNEKITIEYTENGAVQKYSVLTDDNGRAFLALLNEAPGQYNVKVIYNGTDKYNGCTSEKTITIEEGESTTESTQTTQNSTASTVKYNNATSSASSQQKTASTPIQTYYDSELNVNYDANGKVIGGQSDGANIWDLRNNPPQISEDGSLE